jgi:hypothetical protein
VITEPVPDLLEELGWTGGECITDSRAMIHYFRTTADGRIAFGWGGGRIVRGARLGGRAEVDPGLAHQVEAHLRRFFPILGGRAVTHAWGGPLGAPRDFMTTMMYDPAQGIASARGYVGNGVATTNLAGRVLADLITGRPENLADVGFGVSQVLPILATLATCATGSTVLIEQPELHLHPAGEAGGGGPGKPLRRSRGGGAGGDPVLAGRRAHRACAQLACATRGRIG